MVVSNDLAETLQGLALLYARKQGWCSPDGKDITHGFMGGAIVYISGPMTGLPNYNRQAFWLAEAALNLVGVATLSPAHQTASGLEYEDYMRKDFQMILEANTLFALKGWEDSNGAKAEIAMGQSLNYTLFSEI